MKMLKFSNLASVLMLLLLAFAMNASALEVDTTVGSPTYGKIINWDFTPYGAGPFMGNWTNGSPPMTTGINAMDIGEYSDKVWAENNNASPINYPNYKYPTFTYNGQTFYAEYVPSPGGTYGNTVSMGERFDVELIAWRLAGKKAETGKDRIQVLVISSFDPELGREYNSSYTNYHLGDVFIDANDDGQYDRALTTGPWSTSRYHDGATGQLITHQTPIGLYSVNKVHDIAKSYELGWYDVQLTDSRWIKDLTHPFVVAADPSNVNKGGDLAYSVVKLGYGSPLMGANENSTWIQEWTFDVDSLGLTPDPGFDVPTVNQLRNMKFHLTTECGNDYLYCRGSQLGSTGKIGDTVYYDANGNKIQDNGEQGIKGVIVQLYTIPLIDGANPYPVAATVTDENGYYIFQNLPQGGYIVTVDSSSPAIQGMYATQIPLKGTGETNPIILGPSDAYLDADFGFITPNPSIKLVKYVGSTGDAQNGDWYDADVAPWPEFSVDSNVYFKFVVTNTGNMDLTNVSLIDSLYNEQSGLQFKPTLPATLKKGESFTYVYGPVKAVVGEHKNVATAAGTPPMGNPVSDVNPATYVVPALPKIKVQKFVGLSADVNGAWDDANAAPGPDIRMGTDVYFKFVITNPGNVTLTNIGLADSVFKSDSTPSFAPADLPASLPPLGSYTYVYGPVKAAAIQHENTATAMGDYQDVKVSSEDSAHYFGAAPSISITKLVGASDDPNAADWDDANSAPGPNYRVCSKVYFKFVVSNTGNIPLNNVVLTDDLLKINLPIGNLEPIGASNDADKDVYIYGPVDVTAGQHTNTATATGISRNGVTVTASDVANYFGAQYSIEVKKYVRTSPDTWVDANEKPGPSITIGSCVYFKFVVTNTGNVALTRLTLTDSVYKPCSCQPFSPDLPDVLAPGESYTYIYGPVLAVPCQHTNIATATGYPVNVCTPVCDTDPANYYGVCPSWLRCGDTATIGFWHNKNGQALIKSLNGGPGARNLANWLASNFPYLYGANANGNNMTGKTNADVAALFEKFFSVKGQKTQAQILGAALAVYVTDSDLAGSAAARYGFNVTDSGTGARVFNVGFYGLVIGLSNNTIYTVMDLLQAANYQTSLGTFNANAFNIIFDAINNIGDIR